MTTDELDKTIPPQRPAGNDYLRQMETEEAQTMAPRRERKTDGRFAVGDLIMGRYKVLSELGQGGMGVVYKCFDETAGIEVALKALPPELSHNSLEMDDIKDNFQLVHNLHHPNIASSNNLERNPENGNYYLIMECCEGEDLRRWIKRKRKDNPLTLNDVLPVIRQVAEALDYAHAQKIIHRDIKPGNIMIMAAGTVKVLDFGLAAQIHTSMTRVSMAYRGTSGTGPYMAPEQWRGRPQGAAADQYALAVRAYEILAGRLPFESTDPAVLKQAVLDEMPDEIPDLPSAVQNALKRALSKDPAARFNSCADFAAALGGAKVAKAKKVSSGKSGGGAWKWIAAVIVLALIAAGSFFALNRTAATPTAPVPADTTAEQKAADAEARAKAEAEAIEEAKRIVKEEPKKTITIADGVQLTMIGVEPGSFMMGSENGNSDEKPVHRVTLTKPYYLGETEVTQDQWNAVMENSPFHIRYLEDDYPVEWVSWDDAMAFCQKLNDQGRAPKGWKFTLPTEAQWEYAARGGNRSRGYTYSGSNDVDDVAWYYGNSGRERLDESAWSYDKLYGNACIKHAVRQKEANELGLYDMSGNVGEWCLDRYGSYSSGAVTDPQGPDSGSWRVLRGGGWRSYARYCRSASRGGSHPVCRCDYDGFRLALVPVQ